MSIVKLVRTLPHRLTVASTYETNRDVGTRVKRSLHRRSSIYGRVAIWSPSFAWR